MFGMTLGHVWDDFGPCLGSLWVGFGSTPGRVLANFGTGQGTIWGISGQLFDIIGAEFDQKGFH